MKKYVRIGREQFEICGAPTPYQINRPYYNIKHCYNNPSETKLDIDYSCFSFIVDNFGIDNVKKMGIKSFNTFVFTYGAVIKNDMLGGYIVIEITRSRNRLYVDPDCYSTPEDIQRAIGLQRGTQGGY